MGHAVRHRAQWFSALAIALGMCLCAGHAGAAPPAVGAAAGAAKPDIQVALARPAPQSQPSTQAAAEAAQPKAERRLTVAIASEPVNSQSNGGLRSLVQERSLSVALGQSVKVVTLKSLREVARAAWAGELDAGWLPANLGVNLLSKGYTLLGSDGRTMPMALLTTARIHEARDLVGKTMYLPQEDSLAAYVGIAMLSERGVRLSDFQSVSTIGTYEVAHLAITLGINDVTVLPEDAALDWLKANPGKGRILGTSPEVPAQVLVARTSLDPAVKAKLAAWASTNLVESGKLAMPSPDTLKYVARIAHYTPDDLDGVTRVTARQAKELLASGVALVDVRSYKEFEAKRIQGAQLVSYTEVSGRIPGGDYAKDPFPLTEVAAKRVIFYCNGPECWKSYKASKRGLDSKKFERVYWLRGGLPEWEREGLPMTQS